MAASFKYKLGEWVELNVIALTGAWQITNRGLHEDRYGFQVSYTVQQAQDDVRLVSEDKIKRVVETPDYAKSRNCGCPCCISDTGAAVVAP